jgi:hypothetical protein
LAKVFVADRDIIPQRQILDLAATFALARIGVHRLAWIKPVGAQPVNAAGITGPEAIRVLDRQQTFADAPQSTELDNDVGVFVVRDADGVERRMDAPEFPQPAYKPRPALQPRGMPLRRFEFTHRTEVIGKAS